MTVNSKLNAHARLVTCYSGIQRRTIVIAACLLFFTSISVGHAKQQTDAQVVYSDLGNPGNCGARELWSEFGKHVTSGPEAVSFGFVPKKDYLVTSIQLPLEFYSKYGSGHTFQVMLVNNNDSFGGKSPLNVHEKGSVLARQVTHKANVFGGCALQAITFSPGVPVSAHTTYWIVILPSPTTYGGWVATSKGDYRQSLESNSEDEGRTWSGYQQYAGPAAFAVYGTPTGN